MAENSIESWYGSLMPVSRAYMTISFAITVAVELQFLNPSLLYLNFDLIIQKLEFWRLFTNFCFFGKFSMKFVFSMLLIIRYGNEFEKRKFPVHASRFIWCLIICGFLQLFFSYYLMMPFLAISMLFVIIYLWSREFANETISVYNLFNIEGFYLPWVFCVIRVLMGGSAVPVLIGIFTGHVYYFVFDILSVPLTPPYILTYLLDTPITGFERMRQQNNDMFGNHIWGSGQRLG